MPHFFIRPPFWGATMRTPYALLRFLAGALLDAVGCGVAGHVFDFCVDVLPDIARDVYDCWQSGRDEAARRADLERIARTSGPELRACIDRIVVEVADDRPVAVRHALTSYLLQVPATVRRTLRRPADPAGVTVPPSLPLARPE